uniref:Uncharacterized protein LOC113795816 n=1 Tax=Dermatophagoides pteronyssinus TaxID=6956 RepID=A0A6P6Y956_DERPT
IQTLKHIYRQHNHLSYYLLFTNQDRWSRALFNMVLVSLPMNATILSEFIIEHMPIQTQFLFIFVACIQGCFGLSPFLAIAIICKDFHHIKQWIPIIQLRLKSKKHSIQIKMKFDDLYGRLMFGRKIAFSCGYFGDITFHRLFEGFLMYILILFLILGFYVQSH